MRFRTLRSSKGGSRSPKGEGAARQRRETATESIPFPALKKKKTTLFEWFSFFVTCRAGRGPSKRRAGSDKSRACASMSARLLGFARSAKSEGLDSSSLKARDCDRTTKARHMTSEARHDRSAFGLCAEREVRRIGLQLAESEGLEANPSLFPLLKKKNHSFEWFLLL